MTGHEAPVAPRRVTGHGAPVGSRGAARGTGPVLPGSTPDLPYRILSWLLVGTAVMAGLFAAVPSGDPVIRRFDAGAAVVFVLLALATRYAAPRVEGGWGLDAALLAVIGIALAGALVVPNASGQVLVGLGLVLFSVFTAYFRPLRRFVMHLSVIVVGFALVASRHALLESPVEALAVMAVIVGVSVMVAMLAAQLRRQALLDPLTGAWNRRGLDLLAPQLAGTAGRAGLPLTVGLIDLDSFKDFNDTHGHLAGDALLTDVADAWRTAVRRGDLVVRFGGDEFALVLSGTDPDAARQLADRVRAGRAAPWSVGFARWEPDEDLYAALARADGAMFRAKPAPPGGRVG